MLYAARYAGPFATRREELSAQRALAERLLQHALQSEYGLELAALPRERAPGGKPYFPGCPVHFSLSHCRGLVCCGLGRSPLGVDAEAPRPLRPALARRVCTGEELAWLSAQPDPAAAFLSLWTLKESVMKLTGRGMAYGFRQAAFAFPPEGPRFLAEPLALSHFPLEGGFVLSAASRQEAFPPPRLVELPL